MIVIEKDIVLTGNALFEIGKINQVDLEI